MSSCPAADVCVDHPALLGAGATLWSARRAARQDGWVLEMSESAFEALVAEALDGIPPELAGLMDNVAVFVEDEAPPDDPELLGVYEGTPLTERGEWYTGVLPDRIVVFRLPTLRFCETAADVVDEVRITVVHEIAHHFGIDDDRLHELGYA
jgi:predicted Zn-dependent protease with MMP-like domain